MHAVLSPTLALLAVADNAGTLRIAASTITGSTLAPGTVACAMFLAVPRRNRTIGTGICQTDDVGGLELIAQRQEADDRIQGDLGRAMDAARRRTGAEVGLGIEPYIGQREANRPGVVELIGRTQVGHRR